MLKKYSSIENHYREKFIEKWLNRFPELNYEDFIATEKIHGTNLGVEINKDDSLRFQSRNNYTDANFFKCGEFFKNEYGKDMLFAIRNYGLDLMDKYNSKRVVFYGEFFGDGVQKGVKYTQLIDLKGLKRNYKLFDIWVENYGYLPYNKINSDFFKKYFVKIVEVGTLEKCLNFDVENQKTFYGEGIAEGIVIRPLSKDYVWGCERFVLKKKATKFAERQKTKKSYTPSPVVEKYSKIFKEYITENRLQNVFSKYGVIINIKGLGLYMGLMLQDAWNDFIKDNDISSLEKKEIKMIKKSVNKDIKELLLKYV